MKQWFYSLPRRDQVALALLVLALGLWLIFKMALGPAASARHQMAENNRNAAALLARVDAKVTELQALRSAGDSSGGGNITALVSRSSEAAGLAISRLQPNSRGEVQVRFEGVDFDRLMSWLAQVENDQQLIVIDASIAQAGRAGGVNATLRLAGGD
ncbi:MAG: type II secretion system protein GspM [Halieaceae bacterium]|jgi:type II secretory pathway component PulM|nr:type II secretion system protein GspM [Halieaceae bacterium]